MSDKTKTVIEEAVLDYENVLKEAKELAKEELASSMPEKFENLIEQHLNKNKLSESDDTKEPIMADEKKESVEESSVEDKNEEVSEKIDMTNASVNEIEEEYDNMNLDEIELVRDGLESFGDQSQSAGNGNGNGDDIQMGDIKGEIDSMSEMIDGLDGMEDKNVAENAKSDPYTELKNMHEKMSKMLENMEAEQTDFKLKETFRSKMSEMWGEGYEEKIGVDECGKMYETWKKHNMNEVDAPADEAGAVPKPDVEESHGVSLSHNKHTGQESQPRLDTGKGYAKDKVRLALQKESEDKTKRITALLKEQKETTKKLNEFKKAKTELVGINEGFKKSLNEMKTQMKKMAVFNTNIAHVNNLLVNEDLALTKDEKVYIINKFKPVATITESKATFETLVEEFKTSKTKVNEAVEKKITESVAGESSANRLDSTIVEKTAYVNEHINKIKNIMNYVDNKGKRSK